MVDFSLGQALFLTLVLFFSQWLPSPLCWGCLIGERLPFLAHFSLIGPCSGIGTPQDYVAISGRIAHLEGLNRGFVKLWA
ncbi:hypothetical protein HNY73_002816 [Argiope bruennichi]|uniref:Secreted protein n=1 Tax=Argiope bruennichi TaxID=94029 RepID=A0A8T0FUY5_ARGBR|nr:hypothetical protein HNY73_002816 [Argiope bruennichi]